MPAYFSYCLHIEVSRDVIPSLEPLLDHELKSLLYLAECRFHAIFEVKDQNSCRGAQKEVIQIHSRCPRKLFTYSRFDTKQVFSSDEVRLRAYQAQYEVVIALLRLLYIALFEYTNLNRLGRRYTLIHNVFGIYINRQDTSSKHTNQCLEQI